MSSATHLQEKKYIDQPDQEALCVSAGRPKNDLVGANNISLGAHDDEVREAASAIKLRDIEGAEERWDGCCGVRTLSRLITPQERPLRGMIGVTAILLLTLSLYTVSLCPGPHTVVYLHFHHASFLKSIRSGRRQSAKRTKPRAPKTRNTTATEAKAQPASSQSHPRALGTTPGTQEDSEDI